MQDKGTIARKINHSLMTDLPSFMVFWDKMVWLLFLLHDTFLKLNMYFLLTISFCYIKKIIDVLIQCIAELHDDEKTTLVMLERGSAVASYLTGVDWHIIVYDKN
jgi:hypothetical protein